MSPSEYFEDYQIVDIDETGDVTDASEHHESVDSFLVELNLYKVLPSLHAANHESRSRESIVLRKLDFYKTLPSFNAASFEVTHGTDLASKLAEAIQEFEFDCKADQGNDEQLEIENKGKGEEIKRDPEIPSSRSAEENEENKYQGAFLTDPSSKSSLTKQHHPNRTSPQESDDEGRAFFMSQIRLIRELNMTNSRRTTPSPHTDPDCGSKSPPCADISQKSYDYNLAQTINSVENKIPNEHPDLENEPIFRLPRAMNGKEDLSGISSPPAYSAEGSEPKIHEDGGDQGRSRAEGFENFDLTELSNQSAITLSMNLRNYINHFDKQRRERRVERDEEFGNEACMRREERLEETRQLIMSASMAAALIALMWAFEKNDV